MSDERRYYRLGLFVICGFLLALATLLENVCLPLEEFTDLPAEARQLSRA